MCAPSAGLRCTLTHLFHVARRLAGHAGVAVWPPLAAAAEGLAGGLAQVLKNAGGVGTKEGVSWLKLRGASA